MSLIATLPSQTLTALGQLRRFPLEVRQEIYHYYILLCRQKPRQTDVSDPWPKPSLLNNNNFIHVTLLDERPRYQVGITNLLYVNSTIHRELEEVLHTRFVYLFQASSLRLARDLTIDFDARAKAQVSRLSFVILPGKAPGLTDSSRRRLLVWKENHAMLAQCFSNLRSVCFEIRVPSSPVTTRLHKPMMEKCLAVARPFKDVKDLRISWVGEDLGAYIAHLCESVTGSGEDWPWNGYDGSLYHLREDMNKGQLISTAQVRWLNADGCLPGLTIDCGSLIG